MPGDNGEPGDFGESHSASLSSGGGGGGAAVGCTKTLGLGGTMHRGEDRNPARPGRRGTAGAAGAGAAGAAGSAGSAGAGGAAGAAGGAAAMWGRGINGAEVKPQGFRVMGATCTNRGGAAVASLVDKARTTKKRTRKDLLLTISYLNPKISNIFPF